MALKIKIECPVHEGKIAGFKVIISGMKFPASRGELYFVSDLKQALKQAIEDFTKSQIQSKKLPFRGCKEL